MHPGRLSLRTKLLAFNVGMVVVTLAVLLGLDLAFERVCINGPLYKAIDDGQAVVADILPPPLFIVESHLAVFELVDAQAHGDTARVGLLEALLRQREREFQARRAEWARALPPGTVKDSLVDAACAPAATYFQVVERDLLPALHRNDLGTARELLAHTLQPLFADHRDHVQFAVAAAQRENARREASAAVFVERVRVALLACWIALVLATFVIVRRGMMKPIVERVAEVGAVLERIGAGDTRTRIVAAGGDEFDQILQAIDRMRERLATADDTVRAQRDDLESALVEAQSATRAKNEFLANMSHEIRTPMNAILGMTDLALRTELTDRQRGYLAQARAAAGELLLVIDDILDFSRIEAGQLVLESREFSLDEVFGRVTALIGPKAHRKGLELLLETAPEVPPVLVGDAMRLLQVLVNLCSNAVKFTDRGEIVVTVSSVASETDSVLLRFEVKDSGTGLAPEQVEALFRPFSQVDASITRAHGGAGLGLAICRKLVGLMGGEIDVDSTPGLGSTFVFTARLGVGSPVRAARPPHAGVHRDPRIGACGPQRGGPAAAPAPADARARAQAPAALRGRRVLLVEDNELNRFVASELLCDVAGMDVTLAGNGHEALAQLREARFDLVLMDIQMPGMDGLQCTRLIRADQALARLPVIAMTAHAMAGDRDRSTAAGMNDHVDKPFEPAQLFEVMLRWMAPAGPVAAAAPLAGRPLAPGPVVDFELGLRRCLGRPALYHKILGRYLRQRETSGNEIRAALDAGELEAGARNAHTLVSTASMLGAPALAALARELHDAIDLGLPERWRALLGRLEAVQAEVDVEVARYMHDVAPQERSDG